MRHPATLRDGTLNRHQSQSLGVCIREFEDTGHQRQLLAEEDWTEAGGRGIGWVDFQVMRRTHSSLMNDLKVDPKIVADQLGHTLDVSKNIDT